MGVPGTVQLGEDVLLNCTTQPAMPPANIVWYIDGRPERVSTSVNKLNTSLSVGHRVLPKMRTKSQITKGFMESGKEMQLEKMTMVGSY